MHHQPGENIVVEPHNLTVGICADAWALHGQINPIEQVEKDVGAVKEGLNCVAKLVMDGKGEEGEGLGCSRAAVSGR